ncbi:hypothetical protein FBY41_1540 [Humibacillus xanthopallidus]|uniref:Uncharacterized protein n=1 Tax=Humibacillus xanthopallidus TaxID=412689 RepID=A0A543I3K9_9MICO|nr:hypothetical protein FBY41_1540 [Humibacillus xanthopallidus]
MSSSDVARYEQMTDAELYEELGLLLLGEDALGMGSLGRSRLRRFGRDKWNDAQRALRQRLCTEAGESRLGDGEVALGQGLIAAVAETLKFEHAEAAVVSVLLLRRSLDKFCASDGVGL